MIYILLLLTAVASVLFRPVAFGWGLVVVDNLSTAPTIAALLLLAWSNNRLLHRILVPICLVTVAIDTLLISYLIE